MSNIKLSVALNKVEKRSSEIVNSQYVVKADNSDYVFKNLNATTQLLEKECSVFMSKLVEQNNSEKVTLKQLHSVLVTILKNDEVLKLLE